MANRSSITTSILLGLCVLTIVFTTLLPTKFSVSAKVLKIGYLANIHGKYRQGHIISGAMTYAIKEVNRQKVLPGNYSLAFDYQDTRGETLSGTNAVIEMWRDGIIAFIGPENSCEVEATVSAALNLPMISYKCADSADKDISDKDYRYHFARTYPPNTKVVNSVFELLRYYNWNKFSVLYDTTEVYETVVKSIEKATHEPFHIMHKIKIENQDKCCSTNKECCHTRPFTKIVQDTQEQTRIYLFLGDITDMIELLKVLKFRGLLATGNFVVIYIDLESYSIDEAHRYYKIHSGEDYRPVILACQSLFVIVRTPPQGNKYVEFEEKVRQYNLEEPFKFPHVDAFPNFTTHITPYAAYIYDAVKLYADALGTALKNGTDPDDGRTIMEIFRRRGQYTSVTGAIMRIETDGDVEGNYTVLAWQATPSNLSLKLPTGMPEPPYVMLPVGRFHVQGDQTYLRFKLEKEIHWVNPDKPPADEPPCGFDGSACRATPDKTKEIISTVLGSFLVISCFVIYMVYKNWKYEQEIDGLLWRIDLEDIQRCAFRGVVHSSSKMSLASHGSLESRVVGQIFTHTAVFRGTLIAVKQLKYNKKVVDISRKTKKEMKMIREMHHDQINQFIGACLLPNCVYIVTEYCSKGSLQDILENDDLKLDNMFIASLVFDLIKGMIFLHESDLKFHGNLKSSNCVVTSRWVLQVADFGMHELRAAAESESVAEHQYYRNLLWKAPELLRFPSVNPFGTQRGDVYAFGIILHEIIARQGPFGNTELTPKEIINKVKIVPPDDAEPFRPQTAYLECQDYILNTMKESWHERPESRPDFRHIREKLRKMRDGMKLNIMDNMMAMMEKYAYNLEELVDERTVLLVEEKKKTEALLHRMLPKSVANQLMRGEAVIPESFDAVTIYFSDIVGFTAMSASSTPMEVVTFLSDLYTVFDDIISHYDVYKVETIGDAYMVVSGLPIRNGDNHAGEIAFMALELLESICAFRVRHKPDLTLKLRIGIHTGPVAAGVVGLTMPRYCLFGDTVNTASRMESNGEALKIHISPQCKEYLDKLGGYYTQERGLIKVKGKGDMMTYWLVGHSKGLPVKKHSSGADLAPPPPLFVHQRTDDLRKRSPKLNDISRRGSLGGRRNSSYINCGLVEESSSSQMPALFRISNQDSPRSPKRLSPLSKEFGRHLRVDSDRDSFFGGTIASSCGELHNTPLSPATEHSSQHLCQNLGAVTPTSSVKKPKLESICSEDCDNCDNCGGNPDANCHCRVDTSDPNNRNGMINFDESLRPLLCTNNAKIDQKVPTDSDKNTYLMPPVLKMPSKRWRSCDEIVLPKGSKSSLKDFFSGLLGNKPHEPNSKWANNIPANRIVSENCKEESLV